MSHVHSSRGAEATVRCAVCTVKVLRCTTPKKYSLYRLTLCLAGSSTSRCPRRSSLRYRKARQARISKLSMVCFHGRTPYRTCNHRCGRIVQVAGGTPLKADTDSFIHFIWLTDSCTQPRQAPTRAASVCPVLVLVPAHVPLCDRVHLETRSLGRLRAVLATVPRTAVAAACGQYRCGTSAVQARYKHEHRTGGT